MVVAAKKKKSLPWSEQDHFIDQPPRDPSCLWEPCLSGQKTAPSSHRKIGKIALGDVRLSRQNASSRTSVVVKLRQVHFFSQRAAFDGPSGGGGTGSGSGSGGTGSGSGSGGGGSSSGGSSSGGGASGSWDEPEAPTRAQPHVNARDYNSGPRYSGPHILCYFGTWSVDADLYDDAFRLAEEGLKGDIDTGTQRLRALEYVDPTPFSGNLATGIEGYARGDDLTDIGRDLAINNLPIPGGRRATPKKSLGAKNGPNLPTKGLTQAGKKRLAKELGGIPRSAQPTRQGRYGQGTKWWEYKDSHGNRKIVVEHPDGSVHVGTPKPQSQHLDGCGPPKYYPEPGTGHVGE